MTRSDQVVQQLSQLVASQMISREEPVEFTAEDMQVIVQLLPSEQIEEAAYSLQDVGNVSFGSGVSLRGGDGKLAKVMVRVREGLQFASATIV